jgi:hypothetical protein
MALLNYTQVLPFAGDLVTTTGKAALKSDGTQGLAMYVAPAVGGAAVSTSNPLPVGGNVGVISAVPTTAAGAYLAGDVVGTLMTFAASTLVAGGSGLIQAVTVASKLALTSAMDLVLFDAEPTNSSFTDNGALAVNVLDLSKVIGVVHITDWTNLGTPGVAQANNLALPYTLVGTSLYGVLVARAGLTLTGVADFMAELRLVRN